MRRSRRALEGYSLVDNRASGGPREERATLTCSHCQRQVILAPHRQTPLDYCPTCDKYLCRLCAQVFATSRVCRPLAVVFDQLDAQLLQAEQDSRGQVLYLPGAR